MIVTDDEDLYRKCLEIRNIGLKNRSESDVWGYNSRLDSIQAAIVNIKFRYLNRWLSRRQKNAAFYRKNLSGIVECPREESFEKCAYHLFVIQTDRRDDLKNYLARNGIDTKVHYPIPIHLQKCARALGYKKGDFPVTEFQSERILSIPVHQTLTQSQLMYTSSKIKSFFGRRSNRP